MADQEKLRKMLKELWEKIQNLKEEEAKKDLHKRIREMDISIDDLYIDLHFDLAESGEVNEKAFGLLDSLLEDIPQLPAFAHEWSGEGSSSTAGAASSSTATGGASSSAATGGASSSAIAGIGSSSAVDGGSYSSASEGGSSVTFGIEGTEFHYPLTTSQSDIQGQGDISAPSQDSPQQSQGFNGSNEQIEDIIADIRNLFKEEDRESNFAEMLREDRFVYYTEPGLICVEVLDEKIQRVKGYSGTGHLLSRYSRLLDCSGEYDVYKGLSGSNKVVEKEYEASEAGIEAFKSQHNDLLNLKEHDQSENHIDLYGSVSLQYLTQKLNVLMNVCKRRIKKAKEQNGEDKLELMQKKNVQADKAFGVMKLLANRLVELENEMWNLQVDHILLVEKADTDLKLPLLNSELESLMQSTSKELGIPEPLEDEINDLLGVDTHPKQDAAFLLMADFKESKATAIWDSEGKHLMLYQMPKNLADLAKATDKEKMENSMALKTHNLLKGLKLFWPAIVGIPVALAAAYIIFAPAPGK